MLARRTDMSEATKVNEMRELVPMAGYSRTPGQFANMSDISLFINFAFVFFRFHVANRSRCQFCGIYHGLTAFGKYCLSVYLFMFGVFWFQFDTPVTRLHVRSKNSRKRQGRRSGGKRERFPSILLYYFVGVVFVCSYLFFIASRLDISWSHQVRTRTWISAHNIYSITRKLTTHVQLFVYSLDEDANDEELPIDIYVNATMAVQVRGTFHKQIFPLKISITKFDG